MVSNNVLNVGKKLCFKIFSAHTLTLSMTKNKQIEDILLSKHFREYSRFIVESIRFELWTTCLHIRENYVKKKLKIVTQILKKNKNIY